MEQPGVSMPKLDFIRHNHDNCLKLAGDGGLVATLGAASEEQATGGSSRPQNILMYVRKSHDVTDILDALKVWVNYISEKLLA